MDKYDDYIGPYNGRNFRGPEIVTNGCFGIVAAFFFIMIVCAAYGFYTGGVTWK